MSRADRLRAQETLGRKGWPRYERSDVDVYMLEDRLKTYRWCPFGRSFHHLEAFSQTQLGVVPEQRFSQHFSNSRVRASMTPSLEMTDEVLRSHAEKAHIIIVGINDTEEASVLSARELRMASRSTHPVGDSAQQMTDEQRRTAADAAKERMQPAVMECFLLNLLPATTLFDKHHTDGTTKRYFNSEMLNQAEYESSFDPDAYPRAFWQTARETADDPMIDVSSVERKEAAKADLVGIKKYLKNKMGAEAAKHGWTDEEVSEKTFAIGTIRVRLSWIVKGIQGGEKPHVEGSGQDVGDGGGHGGDGDGEDDLEGGANGGGSANGTPAARGARPKGASSSAKKRKQKPSDATSSEPAKAQPSKQKQKRKAKQNGKQPEHCCEEGQFDEDAGGGDVEEAQVEENDSLHAAEPAKAQPSKQKRQRKAKKNGKQPEHSNEEAAVGHEEVHIDAGEGGEEENAGVADGGPEADPPGLSAEELDNFVLDHLPNLNHFDGTNHTQALQRDQGNRSLATWDEWNGTWSAWTVALDDGKPNAERMSAAEADLGNVEQGLAAAARIPDRAERVAKIRALTRTKNKLAKIVAGTAGFTDLSRCDFRIQGCKRLIVDGAPGQVKYTCIPDSLVVVARYIGCAVDKALLYQMLVQPQKEVEISCVVNYAREILKIKMICVSHGSDAALARQKGGMEFATLQLDRGAFIIVMNAILEDDTVERHALAFLADFTHPAYRYHVGVLVDNDPRVNVRFLQPSDRATVSSARTVFSGLFWTAKRVSITSVWQVSMP